MAGLDLQGGLNLALHAALAGDATTIGVDGTIGVTGGMQQIRDLIGDDGQLTSAATLRGRDVTLSQSAVRRALAHRIRQRIRRATIRST